MGIFYNPPPPPVGSNAATPPEPHVPLATSGDQPPRRQTAVALAMVAVLASWPGDLEPRLSRPNDQQSKIAPLTLTYGQQPARVGVSAPTLYALIAGAWPLDLEPRLSAPNNRQQAIAPLTRTYGDAPPVVGTADRTEAVIVGGWPADLEPRLGLPNNRQQTIAPLTLAYGATPSVLGTQPATELAATVAAWPPDLEPRLGAPNNARVSIAPLTRPYGAQPQPSAPLTTPEFQAISAWPQPEWPAQSAPRSLAWAAPPSSIPRVAFPYGIILAGWPADLEPRLTQPNNQLQKIAPLTLVYGSQPAPQAPLTGPELSSILVNGPESWSAQTAPKSAAWAVSVVVYVPPTRFPDAIYSAAQAPDPQPVQRLTSVVPTFPAVSQPPVRGAQSSVSATVLGAWSQTWEVQAAPKSTAWNIAPAFPFAPLSRAILAAWNTQWVQPPSPVSIVTLTLPTGQAPPVTPPAGSRAIGAWPVDIPSIQGPRSAVATLTAVQVAATPLPSLIWNAWSIESPQLPRRVFVAPVIQGPVPSTIQPAHIWRAWEEPSHRLLPPVRIAPLTLATGTPPPIRGGIDRQILNAHAWAPGPNSAWGSSGLAPTFFVESSLRGVRVVDEHVNAPVVRASHVDTAGCGIGQAIRPAGLLSILLSPV